MKSLHDYRGEYRAASRRLRRWQRIVGPCLFLLDEQQADVARLIGAGYAAATDRAEGALRAYREFRAVYRNPA